MIDVRRDLLKFKFTQTTLKFSEPFTDVMIET